MNYIIIAIMRRLVGRWNMLEKIIELTNEYIESMPKKERKKYGQFFTSMETARFMAALYNIDEKKSRVSVLDAGAGSGILSCAFIERLEMIDSIQEIELTCYENDNNVLPLLKQNLEYCKEKSGKKIDINIIDINQMAVNKMFAEHPVFMANTKDNLDVHMGIIGFGEFGQRTLLQALNMSVLSAESKICIDVYDKDIDNIIGAFMKHFSVEILDGLKFVSEEIFLG